MSTTNAIIFKIQNLYLWSMIWNSWIVGYCSFNNCFTFITKDKLHFSLICIFYCGLVKKGWALKVAVQFAVRELVASKPVADKKIFEQSFKTVFFSVLPAVGGSWENMVLKYTKEPNIVCVSYIIGSVHLNKNISDLWSL